MFREIPIYLKIENSPGPKIFQKESANFAVLLHLSFKLNQNSKSEQLLKIYRVSSRQTICKTTELKHETHLVGSISILSKNILLSCLTEPDAIIVTIWQ